MTRRDYIELAAALKKARQDIHDKEPKESISDMCDGVSLAAEHMADYCAARDPRFDRERFLKNAGVGS